MKYYLGISGWFERGHDASAVLLAEKDGNIKIVGAVEEERFTRNRYSFNEMPINSVQWCLEQVGGDFCIGDLDGIAYSWNWPQVYENKMRMFDTNVIYDTGFMNKSDVERTRFFNHHQCHAASAYYPSGYDDALVIVLDGQGEQESGSIWRARNRNMTLLSRISVGASLGYFFQAASEFCGLGGQHAGKMMGLSGYGKPIYKSQILSHFALEGIKYDVNSISRRLESNCRNELDDEEFVIFQWMNKFTHICGVAPNRNANGKSFEEFPSPYVDLAASVQAVTIEVMIDLVKDAKRKFGGLNLCLAGGTFLNCIANGELSRLGLFDNIFIQPASNDAGAAMGAAFLLIEKEFSIDRFTPFLGPSLSSNEIANLLNRMSVNYLRFESCSELLAKLIAKGEVVGLFQGRMEFGPRALGNRSIIAAPNIKGMKALMNSKIKFREAGRPFGPSILESDKEVYFGKNLVNEYMTITQPVMHEGIEEVVHVDGKTRPNIVTKEINKNYYNQLLHIKNEIGVGAVINTSLNCGEPIVNSPIQALKILERTSLDHVIFNNQIIVSKKDVKFI